MRLLQWFFGTWVLCALLMGSSSATSTKTTVVLDTDFSRMSFGDGPQQYRVFSYPGLFSYDYGTLQYVRRFGAVSNSSVFESVFGHLNRYDLYNTDAVLGQGDVVNVELEVSCEVYNVDKNLPFTGIGYPTGDDRLANYIASLNDFTNGVFFGIKCDGKHLSASWGVLPRVLADGSVAWYESSHPLDERTNDISDYTSVTIKYERENGLLTYSAKGNGRASSSGGNRPKPPSRAFTAGPIGIPEIGEETDLDALYLPIGGFPANSVAKAARLTFGFGTGNFEDHVSKCDPFEALANLNPFPLYSPADGVTPISYQFDSPYQIPLNYGQGSAGALKSAKITVVSPKTSNHH